MAQRYETYKDSGVQWLGEIPEHWGCVPFKSVFILGKGLSITKENLVDTGIKVISYGQIHSKNNKYSYVIPELYRFVPESYLEYAQCLANKEDFLIADTSEDVEGSGNFVRIDIQDNIFAGYHTILAKNKTPKYGAYLSYLMQSNKWKGQIWIQVHGVKLYSITKGILTSTKFILPPLSEQQAIVSYLDDKCGKIDEWLDKKQKEVEHLQELKQRVIADAVTRGLNPDVKMKATNIPWLPEIPEHWEIKPIRSLLKESEEKSETGKEELLSLSQYTGITYKKDAGKTGMFEAESTVGYKIVHAGQFVMNIMLAWNGSYAVSHLDGIISPAYCIFNFICDCDKMYYDYLLRTRAYSSAFKTESRGIIESRLRLYPNKFYPFHIPVPPLSEQKQIVSYITEKTTKIDTLVANINKEIENIKEYKQRLISDVVTGQIKVC